LLVESKEMKILVHPATYSLEKIIGSLSKASILALDLTRTELRRLSTLDFSLDEALLEKGLETLHLNIPKEYLLIIFHLL
jgi:hypothetical protein